VGEVDHGEDAVNHGVAQGDEGVDAPQLQSVEDILGQELEHRVIPWEVQGSRFKVHSSVNKEYLLRPMIKTRHFSFFMGGSDYPEPKTQNPNF
jgi:hypothetical protein